MKAQQLLLVAVLAGSPAAFAHAAGTDLPLPAVALSNPQQSRTLSGTVVDAKGEPVIGANVVVKGTTNGTITDFDGKFSLEVPEGATLEVSYIGYISQEIVVKGQTTLQVTLAEDTQALDEVVVVGFGTQKKVNLTGSVATVDSEALTSRPVANATQALQGLVPGLQITSNSGSLDKTASMNIRGTGTIGEGSSSSPLVLIDGMEGDINTINPQDIENISVLKDAAASSIYGSRAPFGVILITTKSGKSGKTSVTYNNSFRWGGAIRMPHMMDSYTFATYFNDGFKNSGWGTYFDDEHMQRIKDYQNGTLSSPIPANGSYWADGYAEGNANVDWYDAIYKDWSFSQEHNVSVNGGSDKISYYASLNYLDQGGLLKLGEDGLKRYNATAKLNATLASWAKFNYAMRFTREDYNRPTDLGDGFYQNLGRQGWPTLPLYDANGYLYSSPSPGLGLAEGGKYLKQTDNTYQQVALILEPVKNWITHIEFNYRINSFNVHQEALTTYNHDVAGNPYAYGNKTSSVHEEAQKENYMNWNIYTEYSRTFRDDHNFHVMAGFQSEELRQKKLGLTAYGLLLPELPEVDLSSGLGEDGGAVTPLTNGSRAQWSTAGFFGRLNYDYKGKYLAEVNLRYDGTSRFQSGQQWKLFPSFSLGWNVAHEDFWEPLAATVGTFKLRGSYGELGNQNTDNWYQTYQVMKVASNKGNWLQGGAKPNVSYIPALVSATLGWETIRTWNIGADLGMFDNRLTGSFDYYNRFTDNMVGNAPELPAILGTSVPKTNNTDLKTYGWELQLGWNDRLQNGLGYGVKFMLSDAQTEITEYPNNPTGSIDTYNKGRKMGEIWGYETIGIAKSQEEMDAHLATLPNGGQDALGTQWSAGDVMYKDLNGDGKISEGARTLSDHGDLQVIGNNTPRFQFGLDLSADYKGFDFRAFFQGVMKRDYWQDGAYFWGIVDNQWWSTGLEEHTDYFRATASNDLPANLDAYYPRPLFTTDKNQKSQTRYLQNGAYIRLKNVQLGYTLPQSLTSKWSIQKLRFYLSGENLWTGTGLTKIFDPETLGGGSSKTGWRLSGENGNAYPLTKTISFGLSVTF